MSDATTTIEEFASKEYQYGFVSDIEAETIPRGLSEDIVRLISQKKNEPEWLLECASRRQKWLDMGESLNLYLADPSGKKLHNMYLLAWAKGLKTTYYLRSLGATQIEKSTVDINRRGLQPRWMKSESASSKIQIDREENPAVVPQSCIMSEGCESCQ